MKILYFGLTIIFGSVMGISAEPNLLPKSPISVRLNRLGGLLNQFSHVKDGGFLKTGELTSAGITYNLRWIAIVNKMRDQKQEISGDRALQIAIDSLHNQLPKGLAPERDKLLNIGKYNVSPTSNSFQWLWVVEFEVEPVGHSEMAGLGYRPTLIVPIATDGTLLLEVNKLKEP